MMPVAPLSKWWQWKLSPDVTRCLLRGTVSPHWELLLWKKIQSLWYIKTLSDLVFSYLISAYSLVPIEGSTHAEPTWGLWTKPHNSASMPLYTFFPLPRPPFSKFTQPVPHYLSKLRQASSRPPTTTPKYNLPLLLSLLPWTLEAPCSELHPRPPPASCTP